MNEEAIRGVVEDLACLEVTQEGAAVAQRLKAKYWAGTALEGYCCRQWNPLFFGIATNLMYPFKRERPWKEGRTL